MKLVGLGDKDRVTEGEGERTGDLLLLQLPTKPKEPVGVGGVEIDIVPLKTVAELEGVG